MPAHLTHDAIVPSLRADLNVSAPPAGTGTEVISVHPVGVTRSMLMHGFELSIALMLNGRRTADEVLAGCAQLGLPLSLGSLDDFVTQLQGHGLLGGGAFQPRVGRQDWSPPVRALYRSALRSAREGEVQAARLDVGQLLQLAPSTPEARRLRVWLDGATAATNHFGTLLHDVQKSWAAAPEFLPSRWLKRAWALARLQGWLPWTLAACTALVLAGAMVPLPRITAANARLKPASQLTVFSPGAGLVSLVAVRDGDRVEKGGLLLRVAPGQAPPMASEIDVTAELSGVVSGLTLREGDWLYEGQGLMRLDDRGRLKVAAMVTPRQALSFRAGEPLKLAFDLVTLPAVVESVQGYEVLMEVENARGALDTGSARVDLEREPLTFFQLLWR